tara:strand:- start:1001 stop:1297 length:297 start_codon:yes stop_codon:yes gene_type:complete
MMHHSYNPIVADVNAIPILEFDGEARLAKTGSRSTALANHAKAVEDHSLPRLRKAFVAPFRLHPSVQFEPPIINASLRKTVETIVMRSKKRRRINQFC